MGRWQQRSIHTFHDLFALFALFAIFRTDTPKRVKMVIFNLLSPLSFASTVVPLIILPERAHNFVLATLAFLFKKLFSKIYSRFAQSWFLFFQKNFLSDFFQKNFKLNFGIFCFAENV